MNDTQVSCFMSVAQHLNFSKAAEELHISQPAVSRYIAKLEQELGFPLFQRTSRTVKLTNSGSDLLFLFRSFYGTLNNIKMNAAQEETLVQREVVVGFLDRWDLSPMFPKAIQILSRTCPDVTLALQSLGYRRLQPALENRTIDIMIAMEDTIDRSNPALKSRFLVNLPHILLYSPYSKVAKIEAPQVEDFKEETFLVSSDSVDGVQSGINELCAAHGFVPRIKVLSNHSSMVNTIASGMGTTLADSWCRERLDNRFLYTLVELSHSIGIFWLDEPDCQRDAVIDAIIQALEV